MTSEHRQHREKYPEELRERAVRMVLDHEDEYESQWEAICSVAERLGPTAETGLLWLGVGVRQDALLVGDTEVVETRVSETG